MIKLSVWKNRLMGIIFYMTIFQLIYDVELLPFCSSDVMSMAFVSCRSSAIGLGIVTGMASASCTCVISALVAYVILTRKRTGISPLWMFVIIVVPSLSLGLAEGMQYYKLKTNTIHGTNLDKIEGQKNMFEVLLNVYDYYRLAQVVFNTVCVGAIFYVLYSINIICVRNNEMRRPPQQQDLSNENLQDSMKSKSSSQRRGANTAYPMFLLAMRLIWYPIAQSVTRFGASWYQFSYGDTITSYPSTLVATDSPGLLSLRLWVYVFLTPSAGFAYFFIFLRMQSGAMREFKKPFLYLYDLMRCAESNQLEDEKDDTGIGSRAAAARNQSTSTNISLGLTSDDRTSRPFVSEGNASYNNNYVYAEDTVRSDGSLYETDDDVTNISATTDAASDVGRFSGDLESGYTGDQSETGVDVCGSSAAMGDRVQTAGLSNGALPSPSPNPSSAAHHQPRRSSKNNERVVIGALNESSLRQIAKGDAKNAAQDRLAKMRKRTSLRSQSPTEVSNIEAIVDSGEDVDSEVLNELDEDELFDLIALQETRSVSSRERQGGLYQIGLGPFRSSSSQSANHATTNSENNRMTNSITTGGSLSFPLRSRISGSQSVGMSSSTVSNPLRNTAIAVSENAGGAGPSGSIGGRLSSGGSASTAPIDISSVHPPRDSTIEKGDETGVSPVAKNRFSQV